MAHKTAAVSRYIGASSTPPTNQQQHNADIQGTEETHLRLDWSLGKLLYNFGDRIQFSNMQLPALYILGMYICSMYYIGTTVSYTIHSIAKKKRLSFRRKRIGRRKASRYYHF